MTLTEQATMDVMYSKFYLEWQGNGTLKSEVSAEVGKVFNYDQNFKSGEWELVKELPSKGCED